MKGPVRPVVQAQTVPRVLLIRPGITHESPVVYLHHIRQVSCVVSEAQIGRPVVQLHVVL